MSKYSYLVTGGAGFIGSNLTLKLLELGHSVKIIDNFATGKRSNIVGFKDDIELIEGDIRSYHTVLKAVEGVDFILHQAALPSVPRSINDPITTNEVNVLGTLNILEASKESNVKRLIFASSSSVYGDNPILPKVENMAINPLSPYAVSKLAAEKYCRVFSKIYGFETVALRYFNVFGPNQDPTSQYSAVIPKFINCVRDDQRPIIYGDGSQSRDFTYIDNVVDANIKASVAECESGLALNCACNEQIVLNDVVFKVAEYLGKDVEPNYVEERAGDIKHSLADISLAKEKIGFSPIVSFNEGLKRTIESFIQK